MRTLIAVRWLVVLIVSQSLITSAQKLSRIVGSIERKLETEHGIKCLAIVRDRDSAETVKVDYIPAFHLELSAWNDDQTRAERMIKRCGAILFLFG